jgi:hypothetical protein
MFKNDRALEDVMCPSLARAALSQESAIKISPLGQLQDIANDLSKRFAELTPGQTSPAEFSCQLATIRQPLLDAVNAVAANPESVLSAYRLTDQGFDQVWGKALKVVETLDTVLLKSEFNSGAHFAPLHAAALDLAMEITRTSARIESYRSEQHQISRQLLEDSEEISGTEARNRLHSLPNLNDPSDDTGYTVRGL